ncbi:MAG: class I tRNA ligase family protein [Nanoarchaeota archaeon]
MSKIILLHGKNNTSKDGWYPWFVNKIKEKNIECFSPDFPNTESPFLDEWLEELNKLNPDENTILVGHSRGGVAIMRWLERLPKDKKVKKVILISSNSGKPNRKGRTGESNGFYGTEYNFEKIKTHCNNFVIIHSRDDPIVPFSVGKNNAESLEADFKVYEDKKHFGKDYTFEIPELLEEILSKQKFPIFTTRPDTIYGVTFMVISAQHPKLMQLVTDEQEKEVKNFLEKLKGVSEKQLGDMEVSGTKSQDSHSEDVVRKQGVFTGSYAINPVTKEKIPIWAGNFVVADYGSGMVMAVPAHDQRDFEFAKKYGIAIKKVIVSKKSRYCVIEKSLPKNKIKELKSFWDVEIEFVDKDWGEFIIVYPNQKNEEALKEFLKKNLLKKSKETVGWYTNSEEVAIFNNKIISISKDLDEFKEYGRSLGIPEDQLDLDMKKAHINTGKLINSDKFNGLDNEKAKEEITKFLIKKKLGRKKVQYKLRDWLISRQRYWGTPIPIVYCDKCGVVAVPEKDLPVKLPKKVKFGEGNPLETNEKWINTKCPKCGGNARRETDTMDTFVNSSWYFLRYCDPHNDKMIFDKKKVDYWCPVDQYIGGAEHACMHLIYFRFYTKFLRDIGVIDFDEPALKLFHQGMLHGPDGEKMSKSRGNVIDPLDMVKTHGTDSLRLALMSFASPDSDTDWDEKVLIGSFKSLNKIYSSFGKLNFSKKPNPKLESKLNKIIKEVTNQIENFKYNLAIIKIRELFNLIFLEDEVSKEVFEKSLKLLHPFCPHITEELWEKLSNKKFISLEKWPKAEETKIDDKFEKQEKAIEKLIKDIVNLNKILETKGDKKNKVYVYVLPNEKEFYSEREISRKTGKEVKIFAVNDKDKYDPENKSKKVKLGRPGIYLE